MPQSIPLISQSSNSAAFRGYRRLGSTDLQVSVIGFGASPLGDVFGIANPEEAMRTVHLAIDEGINFFDVSPYYGLTLAEERLGKALEGRRREIVLSTKCGRYGAEEFDFSAQRVRHSIEQSLRRLRTDFIDLFNVHDVEFGNLEQIIGETIPTMRRLQEEGKTRYIGISGYPIGVLMRIAKAVPVDTIMSYCHYNLLVDDIGQALIPFAKARGIGVINASPLHMGMLTEQGAPEWHPAPSQVHYAARQAAEFCKSHGANLSDVALRFCVEYSRVATTLVGMSTTQQLYQNLGTLRGSIEPEILQQVRAILAPVHNTLWPSGSQENYCIDGNSELLQRNSE
jgi:L-galactose dehydrogenase